MKSEQEIQFMLEFIKTKAIDLPQFNYKDGWKFSLSWVLDDEQ